MNPRYCKQTLKLDCGPIAVLNALKWAGYRFTLKKNYSNIKKKCKLDPRAGSDFTDLHKTLKSYARTKTKVQHSLTLKSMDQSLKEGKSFIFLYTFTKKGVDGGHFIFIHGKSKDSYLVHNDDPKVPAKKITRSALKKKLNRRVRDGSPWLPRLLEISSKKR